MTWNSRRPSRSSRLQKLQVRIPIVDSTRVVFPASRVYPSDPKPKYYGLLTFIYNYVNSQPSKYIILDMFNVLPMSSFALYLLCTLLLYVRYHDVCTALVGAPEVLRNVNLFHSL